MASEGERAERAEWGERGVRGRAGTCGPAIQVAPKSGTKSACADPNRDRALFDETRPAGEAFTVVLPETTHDGE